MVQASGPNKIRLRDVVALIWSETTSFVRRRVAIILVLTLIAAILAPLGPWALKLLVDNFTLHTNNTRSIALPLILFVLSQWLSQCVDEVRGLVYARAEKRMFTRLADRVFEHVMELPLRFHLQRATGAITQTLENGLQGFQQIAQRLVTLGLPVVVQFLTTAWILYRIEQPLFVVVFACAVVCYATAFTFFILNATKSAQEASESRVEVNGVMTDAFLNYETIKFFTAEAVIRAKLIDALNETENRWIHFHKGYMRNGILVATIFAVFLTVSMTLALREVEAGRMTVGEFVLINTYVLQLTAPIEMLAYVVQGFSQGGAMLRKMVALLGEQREVISRVQYGSRAPISTHRETLAPVTLEFRSISVSYKPEHPILRNVSFTVPASRTLGIVGASGGGKSTIVRLLVRLLEPDSGEILFDGVPSARLTRAEVRRAVAVVPQDTVLFNETIAYNIAFGKLDSTQNEIEHAARVARLEQFIERQPDGYLTRVGERGVKLSGGERQRVAIARAALKNPRLYVFDEATSSLDSTTEREIMKSVRDLSRSSTTLIIAHRLSTVAHADEIILLKDGVIAERGTHEDLLAKNGNYKTLWDAQHEVAQIFSNS